MCSTQAAATFLPVPTEPVKVMASMSAVVEHRVADDRAAAHDEIEHAFGNAGAHDDVGQRPGRARYKVGRLEDDAVSVGERRRDLPGGDGDREIPRRDDADDADRLAGDLDVDAGPRGGSFSPASRSVSPEKKSKICAARITSPTASGSVLPSSRASRRPRSSLRARISSETFFKMSWRCWIPERDQAGKAARAASIAVSACCREARA